MSSRQSGANGRGNGPANGRGSAPNGSGPGGPGGAGGISHVSPFIKRDRYKRNFLRARQTMGKGSVKKEDPVKAEADEKRLLGVERGLGNVKREPGVEPSSEYNEFPLRAISEENLENIKTHLLKFQSKKRIDPSKSFHPPIRLHRKDTRNLQFQLTRAEIVQRQKEIAEYKQQQQQPGGERTHSASASASTPASADKFKNNSTPTPTVIGSGMPVTATSGTTSTSSSSTDPKAASSAGTTTTSSTSGSAAAAASTDATTSPAETNGTAGTPGAPSALPKANIPMVTQLEEAGISEHPEKVGMVKYDGKEELDLANGAGTVDPMADVAPDGGGRARRINSKRKTRQLKVLDENAKKLRFEEFYPWVMEDYDGYNTWVGSYEAGNSDSYVLLAVENDGSFTMIPADKVYKFTARNKYATLTIDEAEKRMDKKAGEVPRWLMKHLDNIGTTTTRYDRTKRRLKAAAIQGTANGGADDSDDSEAHDDNSEVELDYDEEFADDEEAPIIDGNEQENKESEQRIKKEMLQANAMGLRDDEVPDEEDDGDLFNDKKIDVEGERIKKALQKTELAALYSSDEDELNPYLSESDMDKEDKDKEDKDKSASPKKERSILVKQETTEEADKLPPKIKVKSIRDCIVVLESNKDILSNFQAGEWNPTTAKKRPRLADVKSSSASSTDNVSVKEEPVEKKIKLEDGTAATPAASIPLITEQDIIDAMGDSKVNVKDFGKMIRKKFPGADNKKHMFAIVKKLCRKVDNEHMELKK
ncbi:transcription factor IIF subunit [Maudiozyma humilis]|uniref:Transcription factor IIF subunit n=1 Tax=Maudiozyma humilis TaxID=51915 RepID=A0AAV5RVP5_MAUHU|nr:transcription factor IIF subunit [Kazachstania humilis]